MWVLWVTKFYIHNNIRTYSQYKKHNAKQTERHNNFLFRFFFQNLHIYTYKQEMKSQTRV